MRVQCRGSANDIYAAVYRSCSGRSSELLNIERGEVRGGEEPLLRDRYREGETGNNAPSKCRAVIYVEISLGPRRTSAKK